MKIQTKQYRREPAPKVKIGQSRQVVIPKRLYDELNLVPGDYLEVALEGERLVLIPQVFIAKRLAEGLEDIKQGRVIGPFKTAKEAVRALRDKD